MVFLFVNLSYTDSPGPVPLWPVLTPLFILVCGPLLGLICLLVGLKSGSLSPALLARWDLAVKLAHSPFYCVICFLFLVLPLFWSFLLVFDVMALCVSSGFGIAAALRARKEGQAATDWAVLHILLHCCFVLDVISAFLIRKKLR